MKGKQKAAPPVTKFKYHHSDALANTGIALRHANHILQSDPTIPDLVEAQKTALSKLLEAKSESDKFRLAMANGKSLDAMDRYKCAENSPICQIVSHETMTKQYAHIKASLKDPRSGALDKIVVSQPTVTTDKDPDKSLGAL